MSDTLGVSFIEALPPKNDHAHSMLPRIGWGLFLLVVLGAALVASGAPTGTSFLLASLVAILIAWRYPYASFYLAMATAPLLGILVSFSTGKFQFGERAFGGSIDVTINELTAAVVLTAWALRVLFYWRGRRDWNWKPWLPLAGAYGLLVLAHLASMLSPAAPDPLLVLKYSLRPVLSVYLMSVVLPANFIKSRRRLMATLLTLGAVGLFFAFDGFRSLFSFSNGDAFLYRARPLPILGVSPIGENHNVLAELLLFTAPIALAYAALTRSKRDQVYALSAAAFMGAITLLTFARSAWIAMGGEMIFLLATVWRDQWRAHASKFILLLLALIPLGAYMVVFSASPGVRSSTDARAMLAGIALDLFESSPLVGVGAGTFTDHVARTEAFSLDFGAAIDSHGVLQKIGAETGLFGLAAFFLLLGALVFTMRDTWRRLRHARLESTAYFYLIAAVLGAFIYQVFNTTYWTPKLWLPVGIVLAAGRVFVLNKKESRDPDFLSSL